MALFIYLDIFASPTVKVMAKMKSVRADTNRIKGASTSFDIIHKTREYSYPSSSPRGGAGGTTTTMAVPSPFSNVKEGGDGGRAVVVVGGDLITVGEVDRVFGADVVEVDLLAAGGVDRVFGAILVGGGEWVDGTLVVGGGGGLDSPQS